MPAKPTRRRGHRGGALPIGGAVPSNQPSVGLLSRPDSQPSNQPVLVHYIQPQQCRPAYTPHRLKPRNPGSPRAPIRVFPNRCNRTIYCCLIRQLMCAAGLRWSAARAITSRRILYAPGRAISRLIRLGARRGLLGPTSGAKSGALQIPIRAVTDMYLYAADSALSEKIWSSAPVISPRAFRLALLLSVSGGGK